MKLSAILHDLTSGEFRQFKLGGAELGAIQPENYAEVGSSINLALTALHTRFQLRRGVLTLVRDASLEYYPLSSEYAQSNTGSSEPIKYIQDSGNPFKDDLLRVEEIIPSTGLPVYLGKRSEERHARMIDFRTVWFAPAITEQTFEIYYRANYPRLVIDNQTDPDLVEIVLPESYRQAFLYKVASRVFFPMDRPEGASLGNKFLALYEAECLQLEGKNSSPEEANEYVDKLEMRGFV